VGVCTFQEDEDMRVVCGSSFDTKNATRDTEEKGSWVGRGLRVGNRKSSSSDT
jgi:hypothetical protein